MKPYYEDSHVRIYHGDCRDVLPLFVPETIAFVTDPPYGVTGHAWDVPVASHEWMHWGAGAVVTATEPYATELITRSPLAFRYDMVWIKNTASNALNAHAMPLRSHERVLVFGDLPYTPVKRPRSRDELSRLNRSQRDMYPCANPTTVLDFEAVNNRSGERTEHPSQKPVALFRWLIQSFATAMVVCDPFMGSGTTLRAALDLGHPAIGIEREERYCEIAAKRLAQGALFVAGNESAPERPSSGGLFSEGAL